jgi:hypothetical protein
MIFAVIGSLAFGVAVILYLLVALGLPYGEFAMGGKYKVVPKEKRFIFTISVLIQVIAILVLLQTAEVIPLLFTYSVTKGICFFFAVYLSFNVIANLISKSKKEKYIMTPLSVIVAACFWITAI